MKRRKILIVGGSGQVGRRLGERLREDEVLAPPHADLDLCNHRGLRVFMRQHRFNIVLIPGAARSIEWCQEHPEEALAANAVGPGIIAEEARGAHVVYFSSDAVFDGKSGPYDVTAIPNPLSVYGESKVEGEKRVQVDRWTVIRTSHIYSYDPGEHNFFTYVANKMFRGEPVTGYTDQGSTPTDADSLADATARVVNEGTMGLLHQAGRELCSRYEFACEVARAFGHSGIVPGLMPSELRPRRAGLVSALLSYREGVRRQQMLLRDSMRASLKS